MESPEPGISASTIVSAWSTTSTSPCPTPTVSSSTSSLPEASISRAAWSAASARPPSEPRVAIERMNTPGSRKWSASRIRSPSIAPCVKGLEGSIESTPTSRPLLRSSAVNAPIRVRFLTPAGWRWQTDGLLFLGKRLEIQIGKRGTVRFGRFVWVGDGTKIRCHEGEVIIGQKTVLGQECTISAYRHVRIGEQCVIADRAMFIDFDHGVVEVERPIRVQGIYKRDVDVGSNVWIGYGACILRGVRVGDNSIVGTNSVVTKNVPANAVVGGVPAKLIRMREE